MIFLQDSFLRIVLFLLGVCGFLVAQHIHEHKKVGHKPLVCPMQFDCDGVVHSDFSKFFGVPLEVLGMSYYGLVSLYYFLMIFVVTVPPIAVGVAVALSISAFLFSLYLIAVQIFLLKKGCLWCFVSAGISILIFICTIFAYNFSALVTNFFS